MIKSLVCLLIFCSNVKYTFSQDLDFYYNCIENNDKNISFYRMCDGHRDCLHGSDESAVQCKYERGKNNDLFYCANGAVIHGSLKCNGYMNCADDSDESVELCGDDYEMEEIDEIMKSRRGDCPIDQWQCPTKSEHRCIYHNQTCDNILDCFNGWDESVAVCMTDCSENEYQCGNGVCIMESQMCDNNLDCIDGTDELPVTCKNKTGWVTREQAFCSEPTELHLKFSNETQFYSFDINGTNFVYPNMGVRFVCHNPKIPIAGNEWNVCLKTGKWLRELPHCERNMDPKTNGSLGCPIDTYTKYNTTLSIYECTSKICERIEPPINDKTVKFECEAGYKLLPKVEHATCMNKTWNDGKVFKSPRCVKFCNPEELYCLDSVKPTCRDENNKVIDCLENELFQPKTTATIGCHFGFKNVDAIKVTCLEDGTWENISNISNACQFDCRDPGLALSKNAIQLRLDQSSSVVFIYEDINQTSNFKYSCAGTIIRPNVVLTAAHCVFNRTETALRVIRAVGKSYIDITEGWAVEKIFYPRNYDATTYSLDIGILQLKLKHSGDDMSNAICLPGYSYELNPRYSLIKGEFNALQSLENNTITVGNLTYVRGNVIENKKNSLEYEIKLQSNGKLCQGDSGSGFFAKCNGLGAQKCLYGVLSRTIRATDGIEIPCAYSVVVARTTHDHVKTFILSTMDQIENKCSTLN